jgi:hypothetical protein
VPIHSNHPKFAQMDWINLIFSFSGYYCAFDPITLTALAMSLAGAGVSAVGSARNNKQRQANLDKEKASSNAFFDREYYTDELDRTENQSAMRSLTDKLKEQTKRTQATNAITGATPEVALAQQNNANKAYADVANRLAGMASQRRSVLASQRNADRRSLYGMQDQIDYAKGQNWANLGANAANLGGTALMADAYSKAPTTVTGSVPGVTPPVNGGIFENNYDNLG